MVNYSELSVPSYVINPFLLLSFVHHKLFRFTKELLLKRTQPSAFPLSACDFNSFVSFVCWRHICLFISLSKVGCGDFDEPQ